MGRAAEGFAGEFFIVLSKKRSAIPTFFSTITYTAIPYFGT
jgi:hypothetical protein